MQEDILKLVEISKKFPGVKALDSVSFNVKKGNVHGLIGENGAGKSTLMKILSGVYKRDSGTIYFDGKLMPEGTPLQSQKMGISIIYQEFNLVPVLSVAENIFLGKLGNKQKGKFVNWSSIRRQAQQLMKRIGYEINVNKLVKDLSVAEMQMVEIAKALSYESKLIIMDEPTAPLTNNELDTFFHVIQTLRKEGITIIFISHKLEELMELCDEITVMRDGKVIDTTDIKHTTKEEIVRKMIGREMDQEFPPRVDSVQDENILEVKNLHVRNKIDGIDFSLKRGEILGLVGLVGAGRTETVRTLFGIQQHASCELRINEKEIHIRSPKGAIENKMMLLPEDRKRQGLFMKFSVRDNISAANLDGIKGRFFLNESREEDIGRKYVQMFKIKASSDLQKVVGLSGGNQQKVIVAKAVFTDPEILIMDEPTRGIDVGAKYDIYTIMNKLTSEGKSIIFISSELNELLGMCDRLLVISNKKIRGEFTRDQFSHTEDIAACMIG